MEKVTKKHGKCYHQFIRNGLILLAIGVISKNSISQGLPTQFITKVNYNEHKEVIFEAVDTNLINCLTMKEIAQFHGYVQHMDVIEVVDLDGDLLNEINYIYEKNVRDDWMPNISKVALYKENSTVIYTNGIEHSTERNLDSIIYMTNNEALNYNYFKYDQNYYNQVKTTLISDGISYTENNGIISFILGFEHYSFDNNTKSNFITYFDSNNIKIREVGNTFTHIGNDEYLPTSEIIVEWILTENGCCVKKTTIRKFMGFTRTVVNPQESVRKLEENKNNYKLSSQKIEVVNISNVEGENSILIKPTIENDKTPYIVRIYDVTGKLILSKKVIGIQKIELPQSVRTGMYLVHVLKENNSTISVGKIITTQNNQTF